MTASVRPSSAGLSGGRRLLAGPFVDLADVLQAQLGPREHRGRAVALLLFGVAFTWWVAFPIHELLHATGCLLAGGEVTRLQIPALYGGPIVARALPFVQVVGGGAGRLAGFDTHGRDAVLLLTDLLPYLLLSVLMGVPLLAAATQARRPFVAGVGLVLGLSPLLNLAGDLYEVGAVLVTRLVVAAGGAPHPWVRGDDLPGLLASWRATPPPGGLAAALPLVAASLLAGLLVALLLYRLGGTWTRLLGVGTPVKERAPQA